MNWKRLPVARGIETRDPSKHRGEVGQFDRIESVESRFDEKENGQHTETDSQGNPEIEGRQVRPALALSLPEAHAVQPVEPAESE